MPPAIRLLSLGAGVQSTTLLLLAAEGRIPLFDAAVFADTGWESAATYDHLARLQREVAEPAGIPVHVVSAGHIRNDALNASLRFASMPLFTLGPNGEHGMARRQCTSQYKIKPLKEKTRELLGYPHPKRVPAGVHAEQAIGISKDEVHRARDSDVNYTRHVFPLLDLEWTRKDCLEYLLARGWGKTPRSACIGCPFHTAAEWRSMRDERPLEFADAVAFDAAIRHGAARPRAQGQDLRGRMFLHRARIPLRDVDLGASTPAEDGEVGGCSPYSCRSDEISVRDGTR